MVADVAVGEGAEDRVGQRMTRDIGIAMALKSMTMRDFHAPDPQRLGRHEALNVLAQPDRCSQSPVYPQYPCQAPHLLGIYQFLKTPIAAPGPPLSATPPPEL